MACHDRDLASAISKNSEKCCNNKSLGGWKKKRKSKCRKTFTIELLKRRLPILTGLPTYKLSMFIYDIIAGITVGLTTKHQSIGIYKYLYFLFFALLYIAVRARGLLYRINLQVMPQWQDYRFKFVNKISK